MERWFVYKKNVKNAKDCLPNWLDLIYYKSKFKIIVDGFTWEKALWQQEFGNLDGYTERNKK